MTSKVEVAINVAGTTRKAIEAASASIRESVAGTPHIWQFFAFKHLPAHLADVSRPFGLLADQIIHTLPDNPERAVALRKLLEAKDAAVRAVVAK